MGIRVSLHHVTHYKYDRPVQFAPHVVRLRPAPHSRTPITAYSLKVTPSDHFLNWQQDPFGNWQARLVFPKLAKELKVEVDLVADLTTINPFDFFLEEYAEKVPFAYEPTLLQELAPYLEAMPTGARVAQLVGRVRDDVMRPERRSIDVLVEINQLIQRSLRYDIRMEPGVFAPDETLERGHGSCRDFAWLLVNVLRQVGFAARFVSGYSIQLKADQKPVEGPEGVLQDVTDLHAWVEAYLPGAGWIGLDATSGLLCGEGHIPLAATPSPSSAAPITGSFGWHKTAEEDEVDEQFAYSMEVRRIEDRPRPTKPYSDAQWEALIACGDHVERALAAGDVRLTMGGEPTFVAMDDPEGDEWNTAALGPTKHKYADKLLRKLHKRFAPGGLLHHGQGKWYPGEPLPRWAYSCYFRKDGEPVWRDVSLIAEESTGHQHTTKEAEAFVRALTRRLGINEKFIIPGFEDVYYYMWKERKLPVNVDPFDSKLESPEERARLRRIFEQGLKSTVGFVLPLSATWERDQLRWVSGPWFLRDERMYLIPGDSPMGYRLPLDSLPWTAPEDRNGFFPRDPFAPRPQLPTRKQLGEPTPGMVGAGRGHELKRAPGPGESAGGDLTRTAVCVESREGIVHVFMPPVALLEEYLDLVATLEETAAELQQPIQLEGYHPPSDHRLERLQVTPDPGVIEVNIQPMRSWRETVANTAGLYEDAKQCRLMTDKFMVDGRHTGTGGGNHITLGGPTPADSPFLRRPDLLRSFTSYWLNHPSLSYLFSGLFVGPTSQAPRMDEARMDSIYELDIAYGALPTQNGAPPPWLVDRVFRHLLVDVTGNTHRTEICIDKLYSPDASSGRQGLVELRAFEMPPDWRMSCAAQLMVRTLMAWFWREPYERPPVRWNTTLVDRFMLPHFVQQDMKDVSADLQRAGFPVDASWYNPQYEFRFPFLGRVASDGVELELRQAIEPWHVLGEQPGGGGTVRYVDSSVERVQVLVRNMTESRHVVACNGRRVPLHPTGTAGEYVAGVRYRAWKPPTALHPTIDVHAPLTFDVLDSWSDRSLGGCTYHVAHPGGRAHENFPRNALEAESRRVARFFPFGHSQGSCPMPAQERSLELPLTLDLRRPDP
ncbi:MAG: transglutaminase family protein [Myxococcales bacterium]